LLSLNDGRDLFNEVVGAQGWRIGHKLYTLIQLLPEFVQDMIVMIDNLQIVGQFHLGQKYSFARWNDRPDIKVFMCSEQSETDA